MSNPVYPPEPGERCASPGFSWIATMSLPRWVIRSMVGDPLFAGRAGATVSKGLPATGVGCTRNRSATPSTAQPSAHKAAIPTITSRISRQPIRRGRSHPRRRMTYKIDRDRETGRGVTGCLRTATTLGVPGRAVDRSRNRDRMLRRAVRLARAGFLRHATYHQAVYALDQGPGAHLVPEQISDGPHCLPG